MRFRNNLSLWGGGNEYRILRRGVGVDLWSCSATCAMSLTQQPSVHLAQGPCHWTLRLISSLEIHISEGQNINGRYRVTQKKRELLKTPTKIEEIQEKKNYLHKFNPLQLAF